MKELLEHLAELAVNSAMKHPALFEKKTIEYQKMADVMMDDFHRGVTTLDSLTEADKLLPQTVRALGIARCEAQTAAIYGAENLAMFSLMVKDNIPVNDAMAHLWQSNKRYAAQFANAPGNRNSGGAASLVFPIYHKEADGKTFTFYNSLIRDLIKTDLSDNIPATLLRAPYRSSYFNFGNDEEDFGIYVNNVESGNHIIEGCYIIESTVPNMLMNDGAKIVDLLPNTPTRVVNLMFVGKPKSTALDDATHNLTLYIQDEAGLTIEEVLDRHFKYYSNKEEARKNSRFDGYEISESTSEEWKQIEECIKLLSKCAVYLNCADARLTERKERTELLTRIKNLGNKKASKQERKLTKLYDYVLVGTKESAFEKAMLQAEQSDEHRFNKPHWRRGHMRMQRYGEGYSKSKLTFISPFW